MSSECDLLLKSRCVFGKEPDNSALMFAKDRCLHNVVIEMRATNTCPNTGERTTFYGTLNTYLVRAVVVSVTDCRLFRAHVHCKS